MCFSPGDLLNLKSMPYRSTPRETNVSLQVHDLPFTLLGTDLLLIMSFLFDAAKSVEFIADKKPFVTCAICEMCCLWRFHLCLEFYEK